MGVSRSWLAGRNLRCWALAAFGASVAALSLAYVSEYGFGLRPCEMCYWQRIPYAAAVVLALAAWFLRAPRVRAALLWGCVLLFAGGAALAAFHAGVEWRWWEGPSACGAALDGGMTAEQILARIRGAAVVSCTDAAVRVLGLSMAGWNALYSAGCAALLAVGLKTRNQEELP